MERDVADNKALLHCIVYCVQETNIPLCSIEQMLDQV